MNYCLMINTFCKKEHIIAIYHNQITMIQKNEKKTMNAYKVIINFQHIIDYVLENKLKRYSIFLLDFDIASPLILKELLILEKEFNSNLRIITKIITQDDIDKIYNIKIIVKNKELKEYGITIKPILELENFINNGKSYNDIDLKTELDTIIPYEDITLIEEPLDLTSTKRADIICQIINRNNSLIKAFDLNLRNFYSISSLAFKLWKNSLSQQNKELFKNKVRLNIEIDSFIRKSYRGGFLFFSKPQILNDIYIYDVNSLYPAMLKKKGFPIGNPKKYQFKDITPYASLLEIKQLKKQNYLGFIKCKIVCCRDLSNAFLSTKLENELDDFWVMEKDDTVLNVSPKNKGDTWIDIYTSEEILYACNLGDYDIIPIEGYFFKKKTLLFNNFINQFHKLKEKTKDPLDKNLFKLILNTLTGRLGIKREGSYKLSYSQIKSNHKYPNDTYIEIASYITAYSRIFMHSIIQEEIKKGNTIFYSATDSVFCSNPLSPDLLSNRQNSYKKRLGKFKSILTPKNQAILLSINNYGFKKLGDTSITGTYRSWENMLKRLLELEEPRNKIIDTTTDRTGSITHEEIIILSLDDVLDDKNK